VDDGKEEEEQVAEEEEEVADEEESMKDNNDMENENDTDAENGGRGDAGMDKGTKKRPKKKLKKVEILKSWRASKLVRRINIELTCRESVPAPLHKEVATEEASGDNA